MCAIYYTNKGAEWEEKKWTTNRVKAIWHAFCYSVVVCAYCFCLISACVLHSHSLSPSPIPDSLLSRSVGTNRTARTFESQWMFVVAKFSFHFTYSSSGRCHRNILVFFFSYSQLLQVRCAKQMLYTAKIAHLQCNEEKFMCKMHCTGMRVWAAACSVHGFVSFDTRQVNDVS